MKTKLCILVAGVCRSDNGHQLQLSIIEPDAGVVYALEASTKLVNWTLVARKSAADTFGYTDTRIASYPRRFYRVVVP